MLAKIFLIIVLLCVLSENTLTSPLGEGLVPCFNDDDCSDLKNATCVDGLCNCTNYELNVCEDVSYPVANKIGGKCEDSKNCNLDNSECSSDKKCVCVHSFVASKNRRQCLKVGNNLGDSCQEDIQCRAPSSTCIGNKCSCQNNTHHEFNGQCFKTAALGKVCRQHEECSLTASSTCINSRCSCTEGHIPVNSKCLQIAQEIGDACEAHIQCTTGFGGGSHCSQDVCQCKDLYQFKATETKCVRDVLLNEICGNNFDCHQPGSDPSRLMCILGVCKCKMGYTERDSYCIEKDSLSSSERLMPKQNIFGIISFAMSYFMLCYF